MVVGLYRGVWGFTGDYRVNFKGKAAAAADLNRIAENQEENETETTNGWRYLTSVSKYTYSLMAVIGP